MPRKSFYELPALYDAIHLPDTPAEASVVRALLGPKAKTLLEPACGTGRYLEFFARLGYRVTGYDVSAPALAFARRRLRGLSAKVLRASMTDFRSPPLFDAAFSLIGTFRHLLTERDALAHLRLTAAALRPGGLYVVGFDLVDYADCCPDEEGWELERRGRKLAHLYMTLPPSRGRRREKVINFVTAGKTVLQDEYDLRSYDLAQWRALVRKSPFRLEAAWSQEGTRLKLDRRSRYALFALRRP